MNGFRLKGAVDADWDPVVGPEVVGGLVAVLGGWDGSGGAPLRKGFAA